MNIWDILILLLIAAAAGTAIRALYGRKKNGGCNCGCGGCAKDCPARREEKAKTNR